MSYYRVQWSKMWEETGTHYVEAGSRRDAHNRAFEKSEDWKGETTRAPKSFRVEKLSRPVDLVPNKDFWEALRKALQEEEVENLLEIEDLKNTIADRLLHQAIRLRIGEPPTLADIFNLMEEE